MQWNKKYISFITASALLLGGVAAVGFQAHAQQNIPVPVSALTSVKALPTVHTVGVNTNAIQNKADTTQQESVLETKESDTENNIAGGGHQDKGGTTVEHQFEGVE